MATGTLAPMPVFHGWDSNGDPLVGGKLWTYIAGTSTPVATYTDVGLLVPNSNPIILDSAGRCVIFLSPGGSYKFVLQTSTGAAVWTQDSVTAVPASSAALDLTGTAGEALGANVVVYLSDGSGGKTAGRWYLADSVNVYSSSGAGQIGITTAPIASGATGAIRTAGIVTGMTGLVAGTTYYVGTAGALTAVAPANARAVGLADTTTSIVLGASSGSAGGLDILQIEALFNG